MTLNDSIDFKYDLDLCKIGKSSDFAIEIINCVWTRFNLVRCRERELSQIFLFLKHYQFNMG